LTLADSRLISVTGESYPVVEGKPILVKQPTDMHLRPPQDAKISQNIARYTVGYPACRDRADAWILHLGSGNVPCDDPRVVSLDVLPCRHVDIVAEAEELPFHDDTFDFVESGAVFEHLYDPLTAIREVKRVLKSGGAFYVDTAFMQSYHGFPSHYFNMTPQAVETLLVDDFCLEISGVPDRAGPLTAIHDLLMRFFEYLPTSVKEELLRKPLGTFVEMLKADMSRQNPLLAGFSEYAMRSMAASFVVVAIKPDRYGQRAASIRSDAKLFQDCEVLKRQYYTLRMEVMQRHHEVVYFQRMCREKQGHHGPFLPDAPLLESVLLQGKVADPLCVDQLRESVRRLREDVERLRQKRDEWIVAYLNALPAQAA
jgi:SAM-dependent methyltransferase